MSPTSPPCRGGAPTSGSHQCATPRGSPLRMMPRDHEGAIPMPEPVIEQNKEALASLIDQVRKHGIVPFIGAGMSAPHYPLWSKFLLDNAKDQRILSHVRNLLRGYKYEEAA